MGSDVWQLELYVCPFSSKVYYFQRWIHKHTEACSKDMFSWLTQQTSLFFLENASFASVCFSLIITTAVVAEPKQRIRVQHRKTWVCMIMEGSLSFIAVKLYCMLQCNLRPSPGAVFEVSTWQCGLDTLVHLFKSNLLDLKRHFWSMIVQIFVRFLSSRSADWGT